MQLNSSFNIQQEEQPKRKGIKHNLTPELQEQRREIRRRDGNARKRAYRSRLRWIKEHEPRVAQLAFLAQVLWGCEPAPQESSVQHKRWMNEEAYMKERNQEFKEWTAHTITFMYVPSLFCPPPFGPKLKYSIY